MNPPLLTDEAFAQLRRRVELKGGASLLRSDSAAGTRLFIRQERAGLKATVFELQSLDDLEAVVAGAST